MNRILVLNSSVNLESSVSRELVEEAVRRLLEVSPDATVVRRDLGDAHIQHLKPENVAGVRAVATTADEREAEALSDELIEELRSADVLVIGAPMYNFSIPSTLRAWFDHILRPRVTFAYGDDGPEGLVKGVRAIVIETRGGFYSEGPNKALDFQEPYLKQVLGFIGIEDVSFVRAERIGMGPDARDAAIASAKEQIGAAVARLTSGRAAPTQVDETPAEDVAANHAALMSANLTRVFGQRDSALRLAAIREIYAADAVLYEPGHAAAGHEAISQAVSELLDHLPPTFEFTAIRPVVGHHGLGRLQWRSGPFGGPAAVTGTDVAHIESGRIKTLHVFLDQEAA